MRGTLERGSRASAVPGIIPAYAGNTFAPVAPISNYRDHPRVCGEHATMYTWVSSPGGSSPRMRGTPACPRLLDLLTGIIPAYAGNTCCPSFLLQLRWDHPRVCGEHAHDVELTCLTGGSSPRMRGTLHVRLGGHHRNGIIPAYAGNTMIVPVAHIHRWDHPRVCGEHRSDFGSVVAFPGSSPRMRGTRCLRCRLRRRLGIIPAYAGNTSARTTASPALGSSPRMRGTQARLVIHERIDGIIPAYAGNTVPRIPLMVCNWDHPRVCGEHVWLRYGYYVQRGSSPRMRGTQRYGSTYEQAAGIIPAYAGNTTRPVEY